jgi:serine/threonine protein kinase
MASCEDLEPHILDKYNVIQRLGKGAYGVVWRAVLKETGEEVAIKKVEPCYAGLRRLPQLDGRATNIPRSDVSKRTVSARERRQAALLD